MAESKSTSQWLRDLLLLPLIVGIVVGGFTYGLPKILEKGKQVSYTIEEPVIYLDTNQEGIGGVEIKVNDKSVSSLYLYRVHIVNSGNVPLIDFPARLVFNTNSQDFEIFTIDHGTKPRYEFGTISEARIGHNSVKFTYSLLNPKDEDTVTLLVNGSPSLELFAKAEGVTVVKKVEKTNWLDYISVALGLVSLVASILTELIKTPIRKLFRFGERKSRAA